MTPNPDPAVHAVFATVTTAVQSMSAFHHTDAALAADAPPLSPTEQALTFEGAPRRRLRATTWQDHAADAAVGRCPLIRRRAETPLSPAARSGARPKIV